nr:hypothetical protein CFP56_07454 [Quercus suber]
MLVLELARPDVRLFPARARKEKLQDQQLKVTKSRCTSTAKALKTSTLQISSTANKSLVQGGRIALSLGVAREKKDHPQNREFKIDKKCQHYEGRVLESMLAKLIRYAAGGYICVCLAAEDRKCGCHLLHEKNGATCVLAPH